MIADSPCKETDIFVCLSFAPVCNVLYSLAQKAAVGSIQSVCQNLRPVKPFPTDVSSRKFHPLLFRPHKQISSISALLQDLDKTTAVAKCVKIYCDTGHRMKFLHKISASNDDLPQDTFAGGKVTVRLQVPAAHNVPFPRFNQRLYATK